MKSGYVIRVWADGVLKSIDDYGCQSLYSDLGHVRTALGRLKGRHIAYNDYAMRSNKQPIKYEYGEQLVHLNPDREIRLYKGKSK